MKKIALLLCLMMISLVSVSCSLDDNNESGRRKEPVEINILPETAYAKSSLIENLYVEGILFTEGKEDDTSLLIADNDFYHDIEYEKGYQYKVGTFKTTFNHQGELSTQFEFVALLSKKEAVVTPSEEELLLTVSPYLVKIQNILSSDRQLAMLAKVQEEEEEESLDPFPIMKIEGFDYEEDFTYELKVKKSIKNNPYGVTYSLLDVISKEEK
ncbi:DUF4377 domain-containing protein [Myroides sp. LJL116]